MNSYELSRKFIDWAFENPEKINPNHYAVYFFAIEHCNRLGWREKFGFPTEMAKDATGIKSYKTYTNALNDLVAFGFIKMIQKSKNQYSANIVALVNFTEALDKALDKAISKHMLKQVESNDSIDKLINNKPINNKTEITQNFNSVLFENDKIFNELFISQQWLEVFSMQNKLTPEKTKEFLIEFRLNILSKFDIKQNKTELLKHFTNWINQKIKFEKLNPNPIRKQDRF